MKNHKIEIIFSEEVDQETAEDINNYKLANRYTNNYIGMVTYDDESKIVISKILLDASKKKVTLITEEKGTSIVAIEIDGIKDLSGNVMETYSEGFKQNTVAPVKDPDILDINMVSTTVIELTFDVPVEEETATNMANYHIYNEFASEYNFEIKNIVYDAELKKSYHNNRRNETFCYLPIRDI